MFLVALVGCRPILDFGKTGQLHSPVDVLARVRAGDALLQSVKAEGRMDLESPNGGGGAAVFLAAVRPASLYFEVHDFFGKPQATLTTDGVRFGTFQANEGRYYQGPASAANVSRLLPLELSAQEIVALTMGEVRVLEGEPVGLEVDERVGAYRVTLAQGDARQTLWVHTTLFRVLRSELRGVANGYDVAQEDFFTAGSLALPRQITLEAAAKKTRIRLHYKTTQELELNAGVDAAMFDLAPPEGARVIELDASGMEVGGPR